MAERGEHFWRGAGLALAAGAISGGSVYLAKYGTQAVPDPFVYTTARNLVVGALLLGLVLLGGSGRALGALGRSDWLRLAAIAAIGGSLPFLLFFWGLTLTTAPTAAFIQKTQFLWIALLAAPILGEALGAWSLLGIAALLLGALLPGPIALGAGPGEGLILAATLLWSVEVVVARSLLRHISPLLGATARMAGGAALMVGFLIASGRMDGLLSLSPAQWLWVLGPGVLLLAYVLTWYHALRHAPATVVTSLLAIGAPITALLTGGLPDWSVVAPVPALGIALPLIGATLVTVALWRATAERRVGGARHA